MPHTAKPDLFSEIDILAHSRVGLLLRALPDDARAALASASRVVIAERGARIVAEGETPKDFGYLLDGTLAMEKRLADGRKHIIGMLVPTDMFGRLFDGGSAYDIVALTDCRILNFERGRFEAILGDFQELERLFLISVLDELDSAREWVLLMGARKIVERVASFLLIILRRNLRITPPRGKAGTHFLVRIPIRRHDLAHYLGTTAETISRVLYELEQDGTILRKSAKEIGILNLPALVSVSGSDQLIVANPQR